MLIVNSLLPIVTISLFALLHEDTNIFFINSTPHFELTPTVTEVIFVRAWVLPLCYNARKPCGSNNWIYYRGGPEDVTGPIILCVYYYRTLLA